MKILLLSFVDTSYVQILQKIDQQFTVFKKIDPESHCSVIGINNKNISLESFSFKYINLQLTDQKVSRVKYFNACEKEINHYKPDIIYFRYPFFDFYALDFVAAYDNVVFEHQTIAEYEFPVDKAEIEKKYGPLVLGYSKGIVAVTEEILDYELNRAIGSPPGYVMTNGIDVNSVPFIGDKRKTDEINLFCAARFSYWHGIDRLITGLSQYDMNPPVNLHLAGDGTEISRYAELAKKFNLEEHIKIYDFLEHEKLTQIAELCDIGVGPLAIHRKGIKESCSLKTREFCLRGLPFIYSGKDVDFKNTLPFVLQIPSTDDPLDLKSIVDFASRIQREPQIRYEERNYAIKKLDWNVKIAGLVDFLKTLKQGRNDGIQLVAVPKPVDFYLAKIDEALRDKHFNEADKISKKAIIEYNLQPYLWFVRGKILRRTGKVQDAISALKRSIELLETPEALLELFQIHCLLNAEKSASEVKKQVLTKYPEWKSKISAIEGNLNRQQSGNTQQTADQRGNVSNLAGAANPKLNVKPRSKLKIAFYALRELHLPVLLPVYNELSKMGIEEIGFLAPPYRDSDDVVPQEGLSDEILKTLENRGIPFWGHEPEEPFDCVVIADVCYDRVDGWGPIVCIGHGTISKGVFFSNHPVCRRENFATVLCVPGPWYKESFGNQVVTHIEPTGFSKMDNLAAHSSSEMPQLMAKMGFDRCKKTVLFAPTFNPEFTSMGILQDEWKRLDPEKYQVIFKLHGAAHQKIKKRYKILTDSQSNFYYVDTPDISPYMHACDILVSDVSSVYVEFFALGKPIILVNNPDMHKYPWYDPQNIEYQVRDAAYQIEQAEELHEVLAKLEHSDELKQKRFEYSKKLFPPLDGKNSYRIAAQIVKVANGEIQLNSFSNKAINVYLSPFMKNFKQVEENLNRACFPVNIFSHTNNIRKIGSFSVNRLEDEQVPPTPLICMTGEHVFPHQWDYLWRLIDHFHATAGVFGALLKNNVDDRYLQNGPVPDDVVKMIQKRLQAHHKVHKSISGKIYETQGLNPDGMIITEGVDKKLARNVLEKIRGSSETEIPSEDIRTAGYSTGVCEGLYCYSGMEDPAENEKKIAQLTAQLKSYPGNVNVATELKSLLLAQRPMLSSSQCPKRVSIIIPYFHQLDTVEDTLVSICNQTYQNLEIVFVNDGSDDEKAVLEILQTVARQYPDVRINYHYKENTGLADTRNYGIRQASGDYILPLDSDDLIASNFLEKTVPILDQNPSISFVYTEVLFWGAKNEIWGTIDFNPHLLLSQNLMTCTTLFRKNMWESIGGYDLNMEYGYEDWNFWISAIEKGMDGTNIHHPLFLYRRKKNSMLENRVHYDPLAKEQIVRNHPSLYERLTPDSINKLRQYIGIIPPQVIKSSQAKGADPANKSSVLPGSQKENLRFKPQKSRKLLFVCHDFPPYKYAGAQLYACNLAKELNSKGNDVKIFHPVDISARNSNESKALYDLVESSYEGLKVYQININEKNNPSNFWNINNAEIEKKFKELLSRENFDLVHYHLLYRLSSSLPLISKDLSIPSMCTLHDYWLLCPLGHMVDSRMRTCSGPESAVKCAGCVGAFNYSSRAELVAYFENRLKKNRNAYEQIDYKISPSHFLAETHARYGYSKPEVVPLGWLPIARNNYRKMESCVVFGYCGQIIPRKGLDILIKALGQINHDNWKLKIYGEGYDQAYLNAILEQIKNNDKIEYKGKFTTEDLPVIYSEIDVAVIPSRRENYPLTLLEALSAKVPVVVSDVGGVSEMITDQMQGFIYPKDDAIRLGRILSKISDNPQIISELQANIQPIKTIKENAAEMDQMYQMLLDRTNSSDGNLHEQDNSNLQAVILAAGCGIRLGGTNGDKPKCMAEVGRETIIERQIRALQAIGVEEIFVVVGYKQDLLKKFIEDKFDHIKFIENKIYDSTNTIYSLYLSISFLNKDFFYLNGDVLFRKELLKKLAAESGSGMAVELKACGEEEVKVKLDGHRITSISKKVSPDESSGEFIGVGLFRRNVHEAFFRSLRHEVEENKIVNDYFERALDKAAEEVELISVDITGEPVIEIDFPEDLQKARILAEKIDAEVQSNEKSINETGKKAMGKMTSIIILTRNQIVYTRKCIESIFKHTHIPFELIVVDNGSTDGTVEFLESEVRTEHRNTRIKIIKNSENRGFAGGNNQGIEAASGDYILLLNNDVVVTHGWLRRMLSCAERRPEIGIVGPRSNYVSGPQLVEGIDYDIRTLKGLNEFSKKLADHHAEQAQQVLRVVGFCMLIKRAVISMIGGMDNRYGIGNFEDDDFSLRAAIAGFQSWIARDCFVHHFGHRTFIGENVDFSKSLHHNWDVFKEKWGLPADKPYGSSYGLYEMKHTRFDPSIHYHPLGDERAAVDKSNNDFKTAQILYSSILANLSTKPSNEVIEALQRLIESYPEFALAYNDLGVLYYKSGNREKALECYERAVQLDPGNSNFSKNLADFYFVEMGRIEEALEIYVKILELSPQDIETLIITGHICVAMNRFEDARVFYRRVLELEPSNEDARNNLNKLDKMNPTAAEVKSPEEMYQEIQPLLNNGDPYQAIVSLENLLQSYPNFALAHNDLGVLYYRTGDKEKAQHHYERAVELMPDNINLQKNLADLYCIEQGRIEEALQIYVNVLKNDPYDVEAMTATGTICKALGRIDDARDFFNRVLQIEPWNADARKQIEEMQKQQSAASLNTESAEETYRRLQEKMNVLTLAEAIVELEKLVEFYPDFAVGHNDLGVLYYKAGNKEKTLHHYRQAAHLQPENMTLQKNLADFLFVEMGKVEAALQIYVDILAMHPDDVETLLITGHICVALQKFDNARELYERVLALSPDNEDARKNLKALMNRQVERPAGKPDSLNSWIVSSAENESTDLNTDEFESRTIENKPTASIVISLDGIQNRVKECLKSIQAHTAEPYELFLVDCGTSKGMFKWAQQLAKENGCYRVIECARQAGWAESFNQAIQKASGEMVVIIHNDVVVPQGWLKAFKMSVNLEPNIGVVGPMSNRVAGIQQLAYSDESERIEFESAAKRFHEQNQFRRVTTQKLSDFCLIFRRELIDKIGYFDERFASEELIVEDFCNRATAEGYQNLIAADTYVFHYDRHKAKQDASAKSSADTEDRMKYKEKWTGAQNKEAKALQTIHYISKANELSQKGQIDQAVEILLNAIGIQPEEKRLYLSLAKILVAVKRFQDAKDAINEMPSANGSPEIEKVLLLGYAEEGLEYYDAAKACAEQVLAINTGHAGALNLKGILAFRNNDRNSAEKYFKQAIASDPGYGEPYTNLGMLSLETERPQEALKFFEKGFILSPMDLDIATNYHALIEEFGDLDRAENVARQAANLHPNNQKIKYMLIDFLVRQGNYEMAMREIEDAIIKFGIEDGILSAALKVREKLGPMKINSSSKKGSASLCMIIKDEEKYLARCLASAKPIVDELIVVDTGSSDRSKGIALAFGAQVYDYEWQNDFAAARNFSVSQASGEWILILDGDEVISPLDYDHFNKIVTKKPKEPVAYSVTTRNYSKLANIVGWTPNDGQYPDEEAAIGWLPSEKVRLFYGKDKIRFEGAVHELVDPVLKRNGIEIRRCSIPVHHYGRLDKEKMDRKGEIYFDIGQKKLLDKGDDINALRELAIQATILEKNEQALELWERLLSLNPKPKLAAIAYVNMGTIYSRMEKFEDALDVGQQAVACDPDLKEAQYNLAMAELHCGNAPKTISILTDLLSDFPDYPPAQFILSAAYCCTGLKEKGLDGIRKLKNTPLGTHLKMPCLELSQSLLAAEKVEYALRVLGAAIECDIVNKGILDLFTECIQINAKTKNLSEISPTVLPGRQPVKFEGLLQ